jgi:hypothetical protein
MVLPYKLTLALIQDFATDTPLYKACHVFTTSAIADSLYDKIKRSPLKNYLRCLRELRLNFVGIYVLRVAIDDVSFSLENYGAWYVL